MTVNDGNGGANYTVSYANNTTSTITPASLTINAATDTKVYDGGTVSSAIPTVVGIIGPDTVTGLSQAFVSKNVLGAGGSTLSVTGYTVNDGNSGNNYDVTLETDTTGVITKAPLTITAQTDTKVYDDTVTSDSVPVVVGLLGDDTVTGLAETYDTRHAGSGKTLSVSAYTVNDGNARTFRRLRARSGIRATFRAT